MIDLNIVAGPGAGALLTELGDRAVVCDLYDETGSAVYHDLAGRDNQEIREILHLVRSRPGPVLELAAGSGRLTMPLLAAGRDVTAVELSASMLRLLAQRLAAAPAGLRRRCTPVQADMSTFALPQRFDVVVLGTTSVSLLDSRGRQGLYRAVRDHLQPGGRFILTTVDLHAAADEQAEVCHDLVTDRGSYRLFEYWVPSSRTRTVTVFPWPIPSGRVDVCTSTIGVLPPDLLQAELAAAGMTVRTRHSLPGAGRYRNVLLETEVAS